ncbi:MAG: O-antigen ligase family protein, partial [Gemmatimonadales bacterium]
GRHGPLAPPGRFRRAALALCVAAAAALVLPNTLSWRSASPYRDTFRGLTNYREGSGRGRLVQYHNSLRLARRDPAFGSGPGNWPVVYPLVTTPGDPSYAGHDPMPTNPWPSSDWVALLVERGAIGVVLVLIAGAAMILIAARRLRAPDPADSRRAIALLGVLAATAVTGLFDAVLLLAPPALFAGASAGLLLPQTRPAWTPRLPRRGRLFLIAGGLGLLAVAKSLGQTIAIVRAGPGWPVARLERAARYDPANYRIQLMLAQRTPCSHARRHARLAGSLFPHLPAAARRLRQCGYDR